MSRTGSKAFLLLWLVPCTPSGASVERAEAFGRDMLRDLGAQRVPCSDELTSDPERVVLCALVDSEMKEFRKRWDRLASSKTWRALGVEPVRGWTKLDQNLARGYEVDGTPLTVVRNPKTRGVVLIVFRGLDRCRGIAAEGAVVESGRSPPYFETAGLDVGPPEVIEKVAPQYPLWAEKRRVRGRVRVLAMIRTDGTVGHTCIVSVSPEGWEFEHAAVKAVRQWRYRPASIGDVPVVCWLTVHVSFGKQSWEP